jgi:hypothetical protein
MRADRVHSLLALLGYCHPGALGESQALSLGSDLPVARADIRTNPDDEVADIEQILRELDGEGGDTNLDEPASVASQ